MNILILDTLVEQKVSPEMRCRLFEEYSRLSNENFKFSEYANRHSGRNGLKFKNIENLWHYRLDSCHRIIYSFGKYFEHFPKSESDSIVLVWCVDDHDKQEQVIKEKKFHKRKAYENLSKIVEALELLDSDIESPTEEDIEIIQSCICEVFEERKYHIYNEQEKFAKPIFELEYGLTQEQSEILTPFIKTPKPTLVLGGAGTGKTFIAERIIRDYITTRNDAKAIYFTQSMELLRKTKTDVKNLLGESNVIDDDDSLKCSGTESISYFANLNEYCIDILEKDVKGFVLLDKFKREFVANNEKTQKILRKNNLDISEVWTEIRGVIKGSMIEWKRPGTVTQDDFYRFCDENNCKDKMVAYYVNQGIINKPGPDKLIKLTLPVEELNKYKSSVDKTDHIALEYLIDVFSFDCHKSGLTKEEYINISDINSTNDFEKREPIYDIYLEYNKFLEDNNYYDDTDLMLEFYANGKNKGYYDLVVADEVQDYTEIQLFIIDRLCKGNKQSKNIFFCGDVNQNVNPTLFREDRLKAFYEGDDSFIESLACNYRCPKQVVDVSNKMLEECRKRIGNLKKESSLLGYSERAGHDVFRCDYSEEMVKNICNELSDTANSAVLVPDEITKEKLIDLIGRKEYEENELTYIFTIPEIKGMEYSYVICYNIFGSNKFAWDRIFSGEKLKGQTQLRYYFNLFNVGSTRSQNVLGFIDEYVCSEAESKLELLNIDSIDDENLCFKELSRDSDSFMSAAQNHENEGKYEEAIERYKKAGAPIENILRCHSKKCKSDNDYDKALIYALLIEDKDLIKESRRKIKENDQVYNVLNLLYDEKSDKEIGDVIDYLENLINSLQDITEEHINNFMIKIQKKLKLRIEESISKLERGL